MRPDSFETGARRYLEKKRVTLWGDFDLTRPDSFDQAVTWLARETENVVDEIVAIMDTRWPPADVKQTRPGLTPMHPKDGSSREVLRVPLREEFVIHDGGRP